MTAPPLPTGKALLAGVAGWPIAHSRSPILHGYWLREHGIDGAYIPLAISPDDFGAAIPMLGRIGFRGLNVTIPHKEAAYALCDGRSDAATAIGAVNTIVFREDGSIHGDNTDAFGFIENLKAGAPGWKPETGAALVLGAGGAARAVVHALCREKVPRIVLCNRSMGRAEQLASGFGDAITVVPWERRDDDVAGISLVVNTTSLGMSGNPPLEFKVENLGANVVVNDLVYSPLETELLRRAGAWGLATVDGLGMLLHQGRGGFKAWYGVDPEVTDELWKAVGGA